MVAPPRSPRLRYNRGLVRRRLHRLGHLLGHHVGPRLGKIISSASTLNLLSRVPVVPTRFIGRLRSPARPWANPATAAPTELTTEPGIRRNVDAENEAYARHPLHFFFVLHSEVRPVLLEHLAVTFLTVAPRLFSATRRLRAAQDRGPATQPHEGIDPHTLTVELKAEARRLGISGVGVAAYDPKYTFAEYAGLAVGDRVVVCALEQNYHATQRIPSLRSEQAAMSTYGELEDRLVALSEWLRRRGYRARPETFEGESLVIHYGVAAGLGQLGMNGQLLTPQAGSRCRLNLLSTDAPLELDEPVDYGLEGVCDKCQICVRRCPVGAIPNQRKEYRGVVKAKLNTKRCLPILMQTAGCSICMKVCPVQRFGLDAVLEEYGRTGQILGKDTDDLEGYDWPLDGEHYGPGQRPFVPASVVNLEGLRFDPDRVELEPELADSSKRFLL
jgi:ferredoxin